MSSYYAAFEYVTSDYSVDDNLMEIVWPTSIIQIPRAFMTLTQSNPTEVRELNLNTFRLKLKDLEDNEDGQVWADTHAHNTEKTLGGITYARMIEILTPYTITFEDGLYAANMIGANSNVGDRVNTNRVSVRANNSAGLVNQKQITEASESTKRLVESLRPNHKGYGNIWYWDALNGSNTNDGKSPTAGFKTFAYAHSQAADWGHDIIFIVPFAGQQTIITEPITVTKNFVFIRGAGYNSHFHPTTTTAGGNLIEISGKGVEISGLHIEGLHITAPNTNGVYVTGDHVLIKDVTIEDCTGHGIVIATTIPDDHATIDTSVIRLNGKSGLQITSSHYVEIKDSDFEDNIQHGVELTGAGTTEDTLFHHCNFHGNGGYGLKINNANVVSTTIESECLFSNNTLGDFLDNGTNTINQDTINDTSIAVAVWAKAVEGLTAEQMLRVMLSALAGKRSGIGTATETYYGQDAVTPRITLTPDQNGNGLPTVNGAP